VSRQGSFLFGGNIMEVNIKLNDGSTVLGANDDENLRDIEYRLNHGTFINIGESIYRVEDIVSIHIQK
jgi:hypothetical protein